MKFYRTAEVNGQEKEFSVDADDEDDAETEFFYLEQDVMREEGISDFVWTSSVYDLKAGLDAEMAKKELHDAR